MIDGEFLDITTLDEAVLACVRSAFKQVREIERRFNNDDDVLIH